MHPVDHRARSLVVVDDVLQDRTYLAEVHGVGLEDILGGLGIAQDRGQRLVELMSQRRGQLPDRRHSIDVAEILPKLLQLAFCLSAR